MNTVLATLLFVFVCAIGGGFFTAAIGFGGAIFMMLFFPKFLPFLQSTAISAAIVFTGNVFLAIENRKDINWKIIPIPVMIYVLFGVFAIYISKIVNLDYLKTLFNVYIILLGLFYIFDTRKQTHFIRVTPISTFLCSSISGLGTGFFGIGGPPMALYYLSATEGKKKEYIATLTTFFSISMVSTIAARITSGILTIDALPLVIIGTVGVYFGKQIGTFVNGKIDQQYFKIIICIFMILSGVIPIATSIIN